METSSIYVERFPPIRTADPAAKLKSMKSWIVWFLCIVLIFGGLGMAMVGISMWTEGMMHEVAIAGFVLFFIGLIAGAVAWYMRKRRAKGARQHRMPVVSISLTQRIDRCRSVICSDGLEHNPSAIDMLSDVHLDTAREIRESSGNPRNIYTTTPHLANNNREQQSSPRLQRTVLDIHIHSSHNYDRDMTLTSTTSSKTQRKSFVSRTSPYNSGRPICNSSSYTADITEDIDCYSQPSSPQPSLQHYDQDDSLQYINIGPVLPPPSQFTSSVDCTSIDSRSSLSAMPSVTNNPIIDNGVSDIDHSVFDERNTSLVGAEDERSLALHWVSNDDSEPAEESHPPPSYVESIIDSLHPTAV